MHICDTCNMKKLKKTSIQIYNKIIIIQLLLFSDVNEDERITKVFKIKGIPQEKLKICNKKFKVVGAIFHEGPSIKNGTFYSMLRKDKQWFKIQDMTIQKKQWPKNASNIYMLFLEEL